jgi:Stress responsive A/B Barrel Domain
MLRHVVMFRWTPETTAEDIAAVEAGLGQLPGQIPEIERYTFGADAGINEGNFQFVVVADFASQDDYLVYRDHPVHQAFIAERIRPHLAERGSVQFETA